MLPSVLRVAMSKNENSLSKLKTMPNSKESEMMVLGCMLTHINGLNIGADSLEQTDFYYKEHQTIFYALKTAYKSDRPADVHIIAEELKRQETLDKVGGVAYLTTLAQYAGTAAYLEEYVNIVKNKAILRQMLSATQKIEKNVLEQTQDVQDCLDEAQALFFGISQTANSHEGIEIKDLLSGVKAESNLPYLKELQRKQEVYIEKGPQEVGITGTPTHFTDLDRVINGLNPSHLLIVAARPAMGKTAFALNIAENVCFKNKVPVVVFSLEMSAEQLLHRIICSQAEVESDKIRTGSLNGEEFQRVVSVVKNMQKHTMIIDDSPGLKITDLRARARRFKEVYGIGLIVVDYLQLLSGSGNGYNSDNRQGEISEISRMLKNLARELNIPVICLSQLSRKVEERQGHRPMMSDLRESGCLTGDTLIQDADTGILHTIKELAERRCQVPFKVFAVNDQLKLGKYVMSKVFYSGKKTVYRLNTWSGRSIKASGNHLFLQLDGWTSLDALCKGDKIALPRESNTFDDSHERSFLTYVAKNDSVLANQYCHYDNISSSQTALLPSIEEELHFTYPDIYWDEIDSIEQLGIEDVYDATVPGVHNFVANDIIVHNSIEQDSDIVMFLLRRDYYDPYDKPGLAEVIVAKNRHGKVGTIEMTYRKDFTQFANYSKFTSDEGSNNEAFSAFSPK